MQRRRSGRATRVVGISDTAGPPRLSSALENALSGALLLAKDQRYATLEHLLLRLTEDDDARDLLIACNCNIPLLRAGLGAHIAESGESRPPDEATRPTAAFQRVVQRAIIHVQSSGREIVTGANVIVAMFAEKTSPAVRLLEEQDITRYDAVNYLSHGIRKTPPDRPYASPL